jgi:hypothetical protein
VVEGLNVWRGHWGLEIRSLNLSLHPLLAQSVNDSGKILSEHLAELPLDLALDEGLNYSYRIECAVDVYVLKWVCLEHQSNPFLFRNNEDDVRGEAKMGKAQKHGHHEGLLRGQHSTRACHQVDVRLFVVQGICLREC